MSPRRDRYGIGGSLAIANAHDRLDAMPRPTAADTETMRAASAPPCLGDPNAPRPEDDGETCRYAEHPLHVCSDSDGRTPPRAVCHAEARARLYEGHNLAGAITEED